MQSVIFRWSHKSKTIKIQVFLLLLSS
jgi:hypothetical protein